MRITFDNVQANQTNHPAEQTKTTYGAAQADRMAAGRGYALDISGKVMDNKAYEGHGRTAEDVMQMMGAMDVSVMRDYLTVMSNTMSAEDFQTMSKEGFDPADSDLGKTVTILDHIKAALIKSGAMVNGYTTDVDTDVLRDITGSDAFANCLAKEMQKARMPMDRRQAEDAGRTYDKAKHIGTPDDAAVKYMVENNMPVSVDGFYQAEFSASGDGSRQGRGFYADDVSGYYSRKADSVDLKALESQMHKVIEDTGLPVTEQTAKEAGWLVEKGIPLTTEHLDLLHRIHEIEMPISDELLAKAAAAALAEGKAPGSADLSKPENLIERAQALADEVGKFTGEDADAVADAGKKMNIRNLRHAADQRTAQPEQRSDAAAGEMQEERIHARMILARTQLIMTTQANLKLLQSGYSIETEALELLVERLEKADSQLREQIWGSEDMTVVSQYESLYQETRKVLEEIPSVPVDVVGAVAGTEEASLQQVYDRGIAVRAEYTRASASYETMMTTPRSDLGDSIRKAFQNVDDILADNMLEQNELNRRAVRILGYNQMEITPEQIDAVKSMDADLRALIRKMTPAVTLEVIRAGHDPLTMSIQDLHDIVDEMPSELSNKEHALGKFLYGMEQKKEITAEEKEACIGVFRLFRQIEKKDDAAVGTLLKNGMDLTVSHLLSALRSAKKRGMDYTVDDSFGGVDRAGLGVSIEEQIRAASYCSRLAGEAAAEADPQRVADALEYFGIHSPKDLESSSVTLEQMVSVIVDEQPEVYDKEAEKDEKAYREMVYGDIKEAARVSEDAIQNVLDAGLGRTPHMFLAMEQLMGEPGAWYKQFQKKHLEQQNDTVSRAAEEFLQALEDGDGAEASYQRLTEQIRQELGQDMEQADGYLDLKAMQSSYRQLTVLQGISSQGRYDVPVTIQGEDTLIHLTFRQDDGIKGRVDVMFETEKTGRVAARFHIGDRGSGYILCENDTGVTYLQSRMEQIQGLVSGDVELLKAGRIAPEEFLDVYKPEQSSDIETEDKATNRQLYHAAGKFIRILQDKIQA